jgi:uracil-DNA glycosylase
MKNLGIYPFGQTVKQVIQNDKSPKRVFVLGVYASAVHAKWIGSDNKIKVRALAVASEPEIFWRGENVKEIVDQINIPSELGRLVPAGPMFNGPSGIALDELILKPLGLTRSDAWLSDLLPQSCLNPSQKIAIEREYLPLISQYNLPETTLSGVPRIFADEKRREEIAKELIESKADVLILLGDKPIQQFLKFFDNRWKKLSDFQREDGKYGDLHNSIILDKPIKILPIAHPRQIAKLGRSSARWYDLHQEWIGNGPRILLR